MLIYREIKCLIQKFTFNNVENICIYEKYALTLHSLFGRKATRAEATSYK
jgi:hypothetical protein